MWQALSTRIGLLLQVSDFARANGAFQACRKAEPSFAALQFRQSPLPDGNALIVRGASPEPKALTLSKLDLISDDLDL